LKRHQIGELIVPENLHLEFVCTDAEKQQARSLALQSQVGGGSKALTTVILLLALVGMLAGFYIRVQREVAAAYRPYVYAAAFGVSVLAWFWLRRSRAAPPVEASIDVSDQGLSIRGSGAESRMPWSAFDRLLESPDLFVLVDRPKTTLLVIPKRAFSSESWQEWFQTLATNRLSLNDQLRAEAPIVRSSTAGHSVDLSLHLRFRDHFDRTVASWFPRGLIAVFTVLILGAWIRVAMTPSPNPAFSRTQMFFFFVVPFLVVNTICLLLVFSVRAWLTYSQSAVPEDLSISSESIAFSSRDGCGTLPWSTYDCYKETPWSFLLWNARNSAWLMLPKRAFKSNEDTGRCREYLAQRLRQSPWFVG
jgi:hypothetical protein